MEYHWDNEEYATAKPMEFIEPLPEEIDISYASEELFKYLDSLKENAAANSK